MKHRLPYSTPDGYFEAVPDKILDKIKAVDNPAPNRYVPYFAFAAMLAIIVCAGTLFLKNVTPKVQEDDALALIDSAQIHINEGQMPQNALAVSDDDIVNYLIYCGYDF